jgi:hypothetical protein
MEMQREDIFTNMGVHGSQIKQLGPDNATVMRQTEWDYRSLNDGVLGQMTFRDLCVSKEIFHLL